MLSPASKTDEAPTAAPRAGAVGEEGAGAVDGGGSPAGSQLPPLASLTAASTAEALLTASAVAIAAASTAASAAVSALIGWEGAGDVAEGLAGGRSQAAVAPTAGLLVSSDSHACTYAQHDWTTHSHVQSAFLLLNPKH